MASRYQQENEGGGSIEVPSFFFEKKKTHRKKKAGGRPSGRGDLYVKQAGGVPEVTERDRELSAGFCT